MKKFYALLLKITCWLLGHEWSYNQYHTYRICIVCNIKENFNQ